MAPSPTRKSITNAIPMKDAFDCLPAQTFHLLGKKHFVPVFEQFYFNTYTGFNDLARKTGITPKQLSLRLKEMESHHLIQKDMENYALTLKGKELGDIIQRLKSFHARFHEGYDSCAGTPCTQCTRSQALVFPAYTASKRAP
jgi:DNA-binding HxlR family transcriptional regulator